MIAPPLIIVGDGQVELFASPAALESNLEAVDVNLYRAFDSEGRCLALSGEHEAGRVLGVRWIQNGAVAVRPIPEAIPQGEDLRAALFDWWVRTHGTPDASAWSLEELVHAVAERDGVTG